MTSQDFIRTEAANTDRIILYREGLFWKAYERSAFAVCSQVRAFKTTKKALKTLGGGHLVSIGFPAASENAVCGALECISREQDRVVFAAPRAVDAAEFEVWKAAQPLKEAVRRTKTAVAAVDAGAGVGGAAGVAGGAVADVAATDSAPGHLPEERMRSPSEAESRPGMRYAEADFSLTAACRVAGALKEFNLAEKTPLECMMFLSELKKMIHSI
ncbi:hypothetical protein [Alistipes senegalensis]|uniref:hypothetical protein n=1 Tax=Alistipes senegalensis TaxID=1288121 RepID=UPI0013EA6B31|nr:hypothetical protein [Alistipes senegalensis]